MTDKSVDKPRSVLTINEMIVNGRIIQNYRNNKTVLENKILKYLMDNRLKRNEFLDLNSRIFEYNRRENQKVFSYLCDANNSKLFSYIVNMKRFF